MIRPERNAESTRTLDNDKISVLLRVAQACGNSGEIDFDAGLGRRQMGRDGRRKTVGVAYRSGQSNVAGLTDTAHIVIFAIRFDPGCHRFQSGGAQAQQARALEERAGDVGLADFGIGAGQEISSAHAVPDKKMRS